MFNTVYDDVQPIIEQKYPGKVQIIFRQQVQVGFDRSPRENVWTDNRSRGIRPLH